MTAAQRRIAFAALLAIGVQTSALAVLGTAIALRAVGA